MPPSHWFARFSAIRSAGSPTVMRAMLTVVRPSTTVAPATSAGTTDRGTTVIVLSVLPALGAGEGSG